LGHGLGDRPLAQFGAHGLKDVLSDPMKDRFLKPASASPAPRPGVFYLGLALHPLFIRAPVRRGPSFAAGMFLFSGSF